MEILNVIAKILGYLSVLILFFGFIFLLKRKKEVYYIWIYIIFLFFLETIGSFFLFNVKKNLFIFSLSLLIHFTFLTYFYFSKVYSIQRKKTFFVIGIGACLLLLPIVLKENFAYFQPYDRALCSFIIMLYSLFYFWYLVKGKIKTSKPQVILNSSVLLFFTMDTFLALATNFLITKDLLNIVAGFWFFRAILLQAFYGALIYYGWKNGKTQ